MKTISYRNFKEEINMKKSKWDLEIERLQDLFKQGLLGEDNKEEVARNFNTSVSQVDDCLMDIDIKDIPKIGVCDTCHKPKPFDEIAMGNGTCAKCSNK